MRTVECTGAREGTVQLDATGARFASDFDPREIFVRRDLQVGKRFVVAEFFVVFRLDIFDQPSFHQQGVDLALGFHEVDVVRFLHELTRAKILGRRLEKIAAGSGLQILRLADIQHAARLILKQVDARGGRETCVGPSRRRGGRTRLEFWARKRHAAYRTAVSWLRIWWP